MRLFFVRHGKTDVNVEGLMHKTGDTTGLTNEGKTQMQSVLSVLRKNKVEVVYSSTENRAKESAQILSNQLNVPLELLDNIQERSWGDWENKTWLEIKEILDLMTLEERFTFIPPNGESWQQMEKRLKDAIQNLIRNGKQSVCVVIHGGALRGLIPILKNSPRDESFKYEFKNASVTIFDYDEKSNAFREVVINDTSHLQEA
jgi:broad specificity phosphatase PhoE